MYSIVYKVYFWIKRIEKYLKERNVSGNTCVNQVIQFVLGYIEAYYNLYVVKAFQKEQSMRHGVTLCKRKQKVIVSLTSFPKRIETVWITIETIFRQTVKPDEVILWLADTQFEGMEQLPETLIALQNRGLTIRFCDDLRSHKKYYYTMQEYPDDLIILMDDDMFYPYDTIEKLLKMHEQYPEDVCVMTAQKIIKDKPPSYWANPALNERLQHSDELQIFSGSGSLYPPNALNDQLFDKEKIKNLCPYADDLWLTAMAQLQKTKITAFNPWCAFPITIYQTSASSLWQINAAQGQNDIQWGNIKNIVGAVSDVEKDI